jgi:hypothetical protein
MTFLTVAWAINRIQVIIRTSHQPIQDNGETFDLAHLDAISVILVGEGADGADIRVRISFQSHVYSEGCNQSELGRFADEGGAWRVFCSVRYGLSLQLGILCEQAIVNKWPTWETSDKNRISNFMTITLENGQSYAIIYRLAPSLSDNFDVEVVVKSAYLKAPNPPKRKFNVKQLVNKCYFSGKAMP